ncbi:MAG: hypothetical protein ACOVLB_06610 [Candidatus Nanopelagicus sp.]
MSNLRILYNNIADTATITASNTAAGFSTDNLKNTKKTSVHRSTENTVVYTLTWSTAQKLNGVALPATNLESGATIRVQVYSALDSTQLISDTGPALQACKTRDIVLYNNTNAPSYTDFGFGGATKTSVWFSSVLSTTKIVITVTSASTIDCARIICGQYWESSRQVSRGITLGYQDSSELTTTRSGNTYSDRKPISETLSFDLEYINDVDRQQLQKIMRTWGSNALLYICVYPDNNNPDITQSYSIYGRNNASSLQNQYYGLYSTSLDITSW